MPGLEPELAWPQLQTPPLLHSLPALGSHRLLPAGVEDAWRSCRRCQASLPQAAWKRGSQSHREAAKTWAPGAVEELDGEELPELALGMEGTLGIFPLGSNLSSL